MRRINEAGLALIKRYEGCELTAYRCPAGKWTIGFGSTGPHVYPGLTITREQAEDLLRRDLDRFEKRVSQVQRPLTDNQFSALVSFIFNCGPLALQGTGMTAALSSPQWEAEVPRQMLRWTKSGGKELKGLVARRQAEVELWNRKD